MFYVPNKKCKDLKFKNIILKFAGLEFSIDQSYYLRSFDDISYHCWVMVKTNFNNSNYGYVLGLPFMQAFNVVFDYQHNRVGFGNKR